MLDQPSGDGSSANAWVLNPVLSSQIPGCQSLLYSTAGQHTQLTWELQMHLKAGVPKDLAYKGKTPSNIIQG